MSILKEVLLENSPLDHGKILHFQIKNELGCFRADLIPTEDEPNQISRNYWSLTVDFKGTIREIEEAGGYAKHSAYYDRAEILAFKIQNHYGLEILENNSDKNKIELIVYRR